MQLLLSYCEEKVKYKKEGVGIGKASEGFTLRLFLLDLSFRILP